MEALKNNYIEGTLLPSNYRALSSLLVVLQCIVYQESVDSALCRQKVRYWSVIFIENRWKYYLLCNNIVAFQSQSN